MATTSPVNLAQMEGEGYNQKMSEGENSDETQVSKPTENLQESQKGLLSDQKADEPMILDPQEANEVRAKLGMPEVKEKQEKPAALKTIKPGSKQQKELAEKIKALKK